VASASNKAPRRGPEALYITGAPEAGCRSV
jgi:hypothetical protein